MKRRTFCLFFFRFLAGFLVVLNWKKTVKIIYVVSMTKNNNIYEMMILFYFNDFSPLKGKTHP